MVTKAKKTATKKTTAKKTPAKKTAAKKAPVKKAVAKKTPAIKKDPTEKQDPTKKTRPTGAITGALWDLFDALKKELSTTPTRKQALAAIAKAKIGCADATASTQYQWWKARYGYKVVKQVKQAKKTSAKK